MWTAMTISILLMTGGAATETPANDLMPSEENGLVCADDSVTVEPEPAVEITRRASCSATADCWDGSSVSCTASGPGVKCSAADSDCPGERGHVTCDGDTVYCPQCSFICNCLLPGGQWGIIEFGSCVLKPCIKP